MPMQVSLDDSELRIVRRHASCTRCQCEPIVPHLGCLSRLLRNVQGKLQSEFVYPIMPRKGARVRETQGKFDQPVETHHTRM